MNVHQAMVEGACKITCHRAWVQGGRPSWGQMIPLSPPPTSTALYSTPARTLPPHPPKPLSKSITLGGAPLPAGGREACDKASANQRTALPCPCDWISDGDRVQSESSTHRECTNQDTLPGTGTHALSCWASFWRGWRLWWLAATLRHEERGRSPGMSLPGRNRAVGERSLSWCHS